MQAAEAVVAARWLRVTAIPSLRQMPGTILGGGYCEAVSRLEGLAWVLDGAAKRKRPPGEFSTLIEVADAAAFVLAYTLCAPAWPLQYHAALARLAAAMREGGERRRRGRKPLTTAQISARVSGQLALDERHRLRLASGVRQLAVWDHWCAEVQARGQTLLTTDLPSPKI